MFRPTLNTGGAITISDSHVFADTSARDTYFASHADELVNLLYIYIEDIETLQQYYTSTASFISVQPVVGIQGDDGADGTNGHSITVSVQTDAPSDPSSGDIWVDTDDSLFNTADDSVLWNGIARPTLAGNANKALAVNSAGDAFEFATVAIDGTYASKIESDLTLYVYEDATGDADGSSKANAYTTLQDAIDAIPDVAQNVTIIVSKGSTNYLGDTTTIQKASVKSLTIQGEFYAYEDCDANAVAGKVVDADADFSDFEVGDRVVCTKYSGTVGASAIEDYFYATITEVGSGYVQTSEETKVPTTGWQYLINQTCIYSSISASSSVGAFNVIDSMISLRGVYVETQNKTTLRYAASIYKSKMSVTYSIIRTGFGILAGWAPTVFTTGSYIETYNTAFVLLNGATATISNSVINLTNSVSGIGVLVDVKSHATAAYSGFFNANKAAVSECNITLTSCYIDSSCTYGAYGYNITLVDCTNNAATPVYNLTSGGSIEEWDGEPLPSIADATGGQVLALKSDKSALEFATVSGGGGITWNEITGTTQSASADNGYITNNESLVTVTLPSTCAVGKIIRIIGKGAGGWKLAQNSGQSIRVGTDETTEGTSGYIESGSPYDSIEVICVTEDTEFSTMQSTGVLGVV